MSKDRKKKKLTDNGQLTIGGVDFSLSIGNILGKGYSADEKTAWERQSKEREPADGLGKMTFGQTVNKITAAISINIV